MSDEDAIDAIPAECPCSLSEAAAEAGRLRARNERVTANLPLVWHFARRFAGRGVDPGDLVQLGSLGLMRAAEKYDPTRGTFSNYAGWWIRAAMRLAVARAGSEEAAVGGGATEAADVPDPRAVEPLQALALAEVREWVRSAVAQLPAKHRAVIELRHNLDGGGERTGQAVAAQLGVSRQRVCQIEEKALGTLRVLLGG